MCRLLGSYISLEGTIEIMLGLILVIYDIVDLGRDIVWGILILVDRHRYLHQIVYHRSEIEGCSAQTDQ